MAMSSLIPGVLFKTTGVNQNHTPTDITTKPNELKEYYRRSSFSSDSDWPPDSPVARKYDVRNTSSRLIMLNNKGLKNSHLRAQSAAASSDRRTSPDRHFKTTARCKTARHDKCHDSSSPAFPTPSPLSVSLFSNSSRGAVTRSKSRSRESSTTREVRRVLEKQNEGNNDLGGTKKKHKNKPLQPPPMFARDKHWLQHPDMTKGQMRYMHNIASVYDITDMKKLKQAQYIQLIYREQQRDFFTPENYKKYINYMKSNRMLPFNIVQAGHPSERTTPSPRSARERNKSPRSQSAPHPARSRNQQYKENCSPEPRHKTQPEKSRPIKSDDTEYMAYPSKYPDKSTKEREATPERQKSPRGKSPLTTHTTPRSESEATTVTPRDETPSPKSQKKKQRQKSAEQHAPRPPTKSNINETRRESADSLNSVPIVKHEVEIEVEREPENTTRKEETAPRKKPMKQSISEKVETRDESESEEGTTLKRPKSRVKSASSRSSSARSSGRMEVASDHGDTYRVESPVEDDNHTTTKSSQPAARVYWEQPAPPLRESEPSGSGLVMTRNSGLEVEGEQIEH